MEIETWIFKWFLNKEKKFYNFMWKKKEFSGKQSFFKKQFDFTWKNKTKQNKTKKNNNNNNNNLAFSIETSIITKSYMGDAM